MNQIRTTIIQALEDADAVENIKPAVLQAFERGELDISMQDLQLDSLARLELLVAIETDYDIVVEPKKFIKFKHLSDISRHVENCLASDSSSSALKPRNPDGDDSALKPVVQPALEKPQVIRLFKRVFRMCRTVSQLHKALGTFEHRLTPLEFLTFCEWSSRDQLLPPEAPAKYRVALDTWVADMRSKMQASGKVEPELFTFKRIAPAVVHFVGSGQPAEKTLLICFSTKASRSLMMPNMVFLQHSDASKYDVLIIADAWNTAFRSGVPLLGRTVSETVELIARIPLVDDYKAIRTYGCSAGGYPALLMAYRLNAELVVSAAGRFPKKRRDIPILIKMVFTIWRATRRGSCESVLITYGARRSPDRRFAKYTAYLTGANRLVIGLREIKTRHLVLQQLLEFCELNIFLEKTIFAAKTNELLVNKRASFTLQFPTE